MGEASWTIKAVRPEAMALLSFSKEVFMVQLKRIRNNRFGRKGFWRKAAVMSLALALSAPILPGTLTAQAATENATVMENCGAYLFTWRPVDCGNGEYFVILNGQNTISESNVILNRGYDYAYTFDSSYPKPWGQVPDLVNVNGLWGVPANWGAMPAGAQAVSTIVLVTNNGNSSTRERYVHVTHLPDGVSVSQLPADVRKYVINTDGSDAGAYDDTDASGWIDTEAGRMYLKPDAPAGPPSTRPAIRRCGPWRWTMPTGLTKATTTPSKSMPT